MRTEGYVTLLIHRKQDGAQCMTDVTRIIKTSSDVLKYAELCRYPAT